jgi:2-keto-4-pentenoate hydratase/2-oxohepta-3-ene-1,7-dioic acid hydratase in catechol pathway
MRFIRFLDSVNQIHYGVPQGDGTALRLSADPFSSYTVTHQKVGVAKLLAPVAPPAILCIGLNYRAHAVETGAKIPEHPVLFMKNPAAIQNPGDAIALPRHLRSDTVDFEGELAIIIGRRARNVPREKALEYVLGFTCANDVSARDWQKQWGGGQFCRGKSFDTFCPLGPEIVTPDEVVDPNKLVLKTMVNGQVMQEATTADMIFDVPTLISFLSGSTTLIPGTVILTGTPSGVGMGRTPPVWLKAGDKATVEIERVGVLSNPVVEESAS